MEAGDFAHNEQSVTVNDAITVSIIHTDTSGNKTVLKENIALLEGEIFDATIMSVHALKRFLKTQIDDAKASGVLLSLHMKATMMKVSDPIIFGHAIRLFFADVFEKYSTVFDEIGVNPNNGYENILQKLHKLDDTQRLEIEAAFENALNNGADLAMVNSEKGITNLHVPSDVIIDASMPAMIRTSGQMWNAEGKLQDTKAIIPDSSYSGIYTATIDFCKKHGAFDPSTMGTVPNVGLMAQKAEEYGSHDKTFEISEAGTIRIVTDHGQVMMEHQVQRGDIWRACLVKDAAIKNWVQLAVNRSRDSQTPAVFWLNKERAHDRQLIDKVHSYLKDHDTNGLDISIMSPKDATAFSLSRISKGLDTISVTGNVLRDYLTDLFTILELGTSAKMLSIVPLMNGGGLFETGAGGSAPKHVQQFKKENYLRWDSLGEFLALAESLAHLAKMFNNTRASILSETLNEANAKFLKENKSPTRKVGGIDNRGSHFFLALYWIEALSHQSNDSELAAMFKNIHDELTANESIIVDELIGVQGRENSINGYYFMDKSVLDTAMRPSATFNAILDKINMN